MNRGWVPAPPAPGLHNKWGRAEGAKAMNSMETDATNDLGVDGGAGGGGGRELDGRHDQRMQRRRWVLRALQGRLSLWRQLHQLQQHLSGWGRLRLQRGSTGVMRLAAAAALAVAIGSCGGESTGPATSGSGGAGGHAQGSGGQAGSTPGGSGGAGGAIGSTFTRADHDICEWPDCPPGIISPYGSGMIVNRSCMTEVAPGHVVASKCGGCIDTATCLPFVGRCRAPSWAVGTSTGAAVSSLGVSECRALVARSDFRMVEVAPGVPSYSTCTGDSGAGGDAALVCCTSTGKFCEP